MKKVISLVVMFLMLSTVAFAGLFEDNSNTNQQGQLQGQQQGQQQGQAQAQGQGQAQLAVAAQVQGQGQEANNAGNTQSMNSTYEQERYVNPSALGVSIPQGNDGIVAQTPFGSGSMTTQSELTQLGIVAQIFTAANKEVPQEVCDQAVEAAKPCRFLGFGPKRFAPLGLCFKGLRKS